MPTMASTLPFLKQKSRLRANATKKEFGKLCANVNTDFHFVINIKHFLRSTPQHQ